LLTRSTVKNEVATPFFLESVRQMNQKNAITVPIVKITDKIYRIRGHKVMLDRDLAELYGVETKVLKQAVKRNVERFPQDFMFKLKKTEFDNLRSQIVTSSWGGT